MASRRSSLASIVALTLLTTAGIGLAQNQTWIQANANNDWSLTTPNWDAGVPWTNGNNAIFGGTGETVEIASGITVNNITFNSSGYTIADANNDSLFSLSTGSIITVTTAGQTATISESIVGGDLNKAGDGVLLLTGANSFDGSVGVTVGTLRLGNNAALGSTVGSTTVSGTGIVELQNGVSIGEAIALGSGGDNFGGLRAAAGASATWSGTISLNSANRIGALNGATLDITGAIVNGTTTGLQIAATGSSTATLGIVRISGTSNTYTGITAIIRGRLQLGADGALPTTTIVDVDSSTAAEDSFFDLNGRTQTIAGLTRSGTASGGGSFVINSSSNAATLTLGVNAASQTYAGVIQDGTGVLNLVKTGAGTQVLAGSNSYTGTTTVSAGTLSFTGGGNVLSGSLATTGGAIIMSGANTLNGGINIATGSVTLGGNTNITGPVTLAGVTTPAIATATLTLNGVNTFSISTLQVGTQGILSLGNNGALGAITSVGVTTTGRVQLQNGITISGKTITLTGTGGNNNGALQTDAGAGVSATWAGNIVTVSADSRIGGGDSATLNVNGVISGSGGILYSRANNSTTVLNAVNTYTGDTQLFANGGVTGARLVLGVDNALSGTNKLSVFAGAAATVAMTIDFNSRIGAFTALDTSANYASGNVLFLQNNVAATTSTLTLTGTGFSGASEFIFNGRINNGNGTMALVKNGSFVQTLVAANGYTGGTTVNAGTLQLGKGGGTAFTGSNGSVASTSLVLNGVSGPTAASVSNTGILALNNAGTSNNSSNRLADTAAIIFNGGVFNFVGSDQAATNSSETIGSITAGSRRSVLSVGFGGTNTSTLTIGSYTRTANGGLILVNGTNLGLDSTSTASVSRIFFTTTPDLVGTTAAVSTGAGTVKNLQIVPGLLGEANGAAGTALGTAYGTGFGVGNTFLTYNATTGLRPLNPVDEFSASFTAGDNVRLTANTTLAANLNINSLIIAAADSATTTNVTIGAGKTLTVASGQILFGTGTSHVLGNGGTLAFGNREGIITTYAGGNTFITAVITGTAGVSYYGTGTVVTNQLNSYSGATALYQGTFIPQLGSAGSQGAPGNGPFGTGTLILAGASLRSSTAGNIVVHNNVEWRADTAMVGGSAGTTFAFTGAVSLSSGTRVLTNTADGNTFFSGVISEVQAGSGVTVAGTGSRAVVFSGANTYTGATTINGSTLVINGSQTAATGAVNVNGGALGGQGSVGGAVVVGSGAAFRPGDVTAANVSLNGTFTGATSLTLRTGSNTELQITNPTFTSTDNFGGNAPGTVGYNSYVIANGNVAGSAGTAHDKLIFTTVTQETGGKITVSAVGFTPVAGQIFNLVDWTDVGSSFSGNLGTTRDGSGDSTLDLDLPDISGSGYLWDTSLFATYGIIVVTPEPGRALLLGVGLAMLGFRRRRR